jgi:hypothetical protein
MGPLWQFFSVVDHVNGITGLTRVCSRRLTASAPLPLPGAADTYR